MRLLRLCWTKTTRIVMAEGVLLILSLILPTFAPSLLRASGVGGPGTQLIGTVNKWLMGVAVTSGQRAMMRALSGIFFEDASDGAPLMNISGRQSGGTFISPCWATTELNTDRPNLANGVSSQFPYPHFELDAFNRRVQPTGRGLHLALPSA